MTDQWLKTPAAAKAVGCSERTLKREQDFRGGCLIEGEHWRRGISRNSSYIWCVERVYEALKSRTYGDAAQLGMKLPKHIVMELGGSQIEARLAGRRYYVSSPLLYELLKADGDLSGVSEDAITLHRWLEKLSETFHVSFQNGSIVGALTIGDHEGAHAFVALSMWQSNENARHGSDAVAWWFQRFVEIATAKHS
jgi:hypothetical protein|tara:strand:- start:55 stop:639 length:585 start_codon:yes stop_codon:yes gene_type:complete